MTRELLTRSFDSDLTTDDDGRTITGRAVPYGVRQTVCDGDGPAYVEVFERGAFRHMTKAPNRVLLRFEHCQGLTDVVGHAVELDDRADGLWARFRALTTGGADTALELIAAGVLAALSVGFVPLTRSRPLPDGTVVRTRCHLDEVSLVRQGAYGDSALAVRGDALPLVEPWADLRRPTDDALNARIAAALNR